MQVICEHCSARLNIPDDKLPSSRRVAVNCPKCSNRIMIVTGAQAPVKSPGIPTGTEPAISGDLRYPRDDPVLDTFEEGGKLALIMGRGASENEALQAAAEALGYRCLQVESTRDAVDRLRLHQFHLLLLVDGFDGQTAAESPVLDYLNGQSMSVRRKMFVALVGGAFKTADEMTGYAMSVNLVVNLKDLERMIGILRSAIAKNERFYKVFMDTLTEIGRG